MAMKSLIARLRNHAGNFAAARNGNVAIIFALAAIPMVGMMGAAIDYSRANMVKADLQAALDATALMVSKNAPTMTAAELQTAAKAYFDALFKSSQASTSNITVSYDAAKSTVSIDGTSAVKSDFISVLGSQFATLPISGTSAVSWGTSRLRVALALDNTGSMASNNKMTALKTAAKQLLTQLQSAALNNGDVYVSIVPFAKDVNVGSGNYNATWLDWQDHKDTPKDYVGWDSLFGTCSKNPDNDNNLSPKQNCLAKNNAVWTPADHNTWNGCVTDRDQKELVNGVYVTRDYDANATIPDPAKPATKFPAEQFAACPVAMMPLSYDWTALKTKIDSMQPNGNTNVTIGLTMAWQTLLTNGPFAAPAEAANYKYQKVIILLTDGENTQNRFTSTQADIDARTRLACTNAKAAGITLYTVLVMDGTQSLLQGCASEVNKYFYLSSSTGLVTAFNQIGTDLTNLRLSR